MANDTIRVGDLDSRSMLYTEFRRTGGDPSFLFELLEGIIERREWENLKDEQGNPVGSFRRLIEAPLPTGCGQPVEKLRALLAVEHRHSRNDNEWAQRMKVLRDEVGKLLDSELDPRNGHGGDRRSEDFKGTCHLEKSQRGNSREYIIGTLKRDGYHELAELAIEGEISAQEARRRTGWEPKRRHVSMNDPESAANTLFSLMERDVLIRMLEILAGKLAESEDEE